MGSSKNRNIFYLKWCGIKRRCLNKNDKSYVRYGGAGVTISDSWMDFRNFYKDMSSTYFTGASIDRVDNEKGYSKQNCRWVALEYQNKNKRNVPLYKLGKEKLTASDWDRKLGLKIGTVRARIKFYCWPVKKALTTHKKEPQGAFLDSRGKYRVEVGHEGKKHFVGRYATKKEALQARKDFLTSLLVKNV